MNKSLFCGVDLHSNNGLYVITDEQDKLLLKKRLPNELSIVLEALKPFRRRLKVVAVESTYNWHWLVDGLLEKDYPVKLANPAAIDQYDGIKEADDLLIGTVTYYYLSFPYPDWLRSFEVDLQAMDGLSGPAESPLDSGTHLLPRACPCGSASVSEPPPPRSIPPITPYAMPLQRIPYTTR